ncbi:MAG: hypothetical protein Tsb009_00440 [Planctomycetaceae bacterium]
MTRLAYGLFCWLALLFLTSDNLAAQKKTNTAGKKPTAEQVAFFEKKIRPILATKCYSCHSTKAKTLQAGLLLDSRAGLLKGGDSGAAVVPGKPEKSLLMDAIKYDGFEMPPSGKLPANVIKDFEQWIQMGMPDPRTSSLASVKKTEIDYSKWSEFWAFRAPVNHPRPQVKMKSWPKRDLDYFILAKLEKNSLTPADKANRYTLIRRATFDLIGLPPTPSEIREFVNDQSPNAFEKVVDRLLKSPHYGERWGRHWLDIARYGEDQAHTFKARRYPRGYLYRDWVVKALNEDMPYDQFLKAQIAGDLMDGPNKHERIAALGLFALGPVYYQDNGEKAKALADEWDDRVDTLTRGLLGLTASCARCHDHKYDPISMRDYYGLAGIFASSQYKERPVVSDEIVAKKQAADAAVKSHQLEIDRFLAQAAREVRPQFLSEIPRYLVAAWKVLNQEKNGKRDKRRLKKIAQREKVSEFLLSRWVGFLRGNQVKTRPHWAAWRALIAKQDTKKDLSKDKAAIKAVEAIGLQLQKNVESQLARRKQLFARYGENVAFLSDSNRATVLPGHIPLGNLFDDDAAVSLKVALASDRFKAAASPNSLGVDRVLFGWGHTAEIAPRVRFDFRNLGSDTNKYGSITNDAWNTQGGIRTQGRKVSQNAGRDEQGIGMHANALITFDLDEIRRAGLMPSDQKFVFRVNRGGLNDDVFGSSASRVHLAVIVAGEQKKNEVYDAIIAGYLNGRKMKVAENDRVYYFTGQLPDPLLANGKFVAFNVPIPAHAKTLTLVSTAAAKDGEENSISSDHAVFSGARLEQDPLPEKSDANFKGNNGTRIVDSVENKNHAILLSEFLSDKGLLAMPGKDVAAKLSGTLKTRYESLKREHADLQKAANAIQVTLAHSLTEGQSRDLKIYLRGNPKTQGDIAQRGFLPILTQGKRVTFKTKGSGRLELAEAIASKNNPLTARVIVNRIWRGHFGFGLVRTPSNFGSLGERPTHPKLLDHLVHRLIASGWSLKALHREIMLSAAYQMSSDFNKANDAIDPDNRLLWRMNRRRLEVEPWRDAMLAVSGRLDLKMGGPPSRLIDANNTRRTLYGFVSRHQLNDLLRLFDFPDPNITSAKRTVTTVPLQQLFVLNSEFMVNQAKALAARLSKMEKMSEKERIMQAYLLLYGRPANPREIQMGTDFLETIGTEKTDSLTAWEQYALALLGANEFTFLD